jgi:predicted P-loop ATPase
MTKVLTAEVQHKHAERQLFTARRALSHLVQLYESGQWRHLYKEEAFADAVRQARQSVDQWTDAVARAEAEAKAKANAI